MNRAGPQLKPTMPTYATQEMVRTRETTPQRTRPGDGYTGNQAVLRRLSCTAPHIQRKLEIGAVNDPLEAEAEQVAEQVMRMPTPDVSLAASPTQLSRKCAACQEEDQKVQTRRAEVAPVGINTEAPDSVHEVLRTSGRPLDSQALAFFEPRFGHDFGAVRLHDDAQAASSARDVGALGYTVGRHVVLDSARYQPTSVEGRRLLAHELAHTVQQTAPGSHTPQRLARQPRSLTETLNPPSLSDDQLTAEISEIRQWLDAQLSNSEQGEQLAQTVARLGTELVSRHPPTPPPTGAQRTAESITANDVTQASSRALGLVSTGNSLAFQGPTPSPVTQPPVITQPPVTQPPVVTEPPVTPQPPVTTEPPIPVPPVAVGVFVFLVIMFWPNNSIMSGSEEQRALTQARANAFNETDAQLDAEASQDEADDVDTDVEQSVAPPGDCTADRHRALQDDINRKCKRLPRGCTEDMNCRQLRRNWFRNERCARARDLINNECFKGGDPGHKAAAAAAWRAAENCREIYRRKRC